MSKKLFAFVLMPFSSDFTDIYTLGIKPSVEKQGMIAERVDEQVFYSDAILTRICNQIKLADFVIADMSGRNPNVFYEVGYAHAHGKLCILITSKSEDIPFDLKHHRHLIYDGSIVKLTKQLATDLRWVKKHLTSVSTPILVTLKTINGDLIKDRLDAIAKLTLVFDFHNTSDSHSPEIDSIHYYTGLGWIYTVDNRECASTASDDPAFEARHIVPFPTRRLQKTTGWAQIRLVGQKTLASITKGDTLEDSYTVRGRSMIRVLAGDSVFDYPFPIDLEIREFPI